MDSPIGAIILAAGGSKRFGSPKQLLEWQGETLINKVIKLAIKSCLDPIIVVLGSEYDFIKNNIIEKERVTIVKNDNWEVGQSTSLIVGVRGIEKKNTPFAVLLCDQPQVTFKNIKGLVDIYRENDADIVITEIEGKLAPPVIFSPICISGINVLKGDRGARSIIEGYRYKTYKETDTRLLMDIDTPEDFIRLKKAYNCA